MVNLEMLHYRRSVSMREENPEVNARQILHLPKAKFDRLSFFLRKEVNLLLLTEIC
jgi:hypothetical protein